MWFDQRSPCDDIVPPPSGTRANSPVFVGRPATEIGLFVVDTVTVLLTGVDGGHLVARAASGPEALVVGQEVRRTARRPAATSAAWRATRPPRCSTVAMSDG
ncbi:hypothetical protein C8E97_2958 [Saccharothrix australiensis]|uniref:Uncharacterized protein n=1 Tax=Saccharothrix australiensis TaxID=2072 RepID=A0A495VYK9_9PSEU|nr:hypothetical protein C8E97_2958 [Saccharothrix australiensis]